MNRAQKMAWSFIVCTSAALAISPTAAYFFVGAACTIPFFILGLEASISIIWLPNLFIGAGILHSFAHSVAILNQYGWIRTEVQS